MMDMGEIWKDIKVLYRRKVILIFFFSEIVYLIGYCNSFDFFLN